MSATVTPLNKMRKVIRVHFTVNDMIQAQDMPYIGETHKTFVQHLFKQKGYTVVNWEKIKFFWTKTACTVEGTNNEGLLSL